MSGNRTIDRNDWMLAAVSEDHYAVPGTQSNHEGTLLLALIFKKLKHYHDWVLLKSEQQTLLQRLDELIWRCYSPFGETASKEKIGGKTNTMVPNSHILTRLQPGINSLWQKTALLLCFPHSVLQKVLSPIITKEFNNQLLTNTIKIFFVPILDTFPSRPPPQSLALLCSLSSTVLDFFFLGTMKNTGRRE